MLFSFKSMHKFSILFIVIISDIGVCDVEKLFFILRDRATSYRSFLPMIERSFLIAYIRLVLMHMTTNYFCIRCFREKPVFGA